jgi:hypothetical protein
MPKKQTNFEKDPFHVVDRKVNDSHVGYDIYCKNRPFLRQVQDGEPSADKEATPRLKRHEAYAIARVLNSQTEMRKWADKFGDPYAE